MLFDQFSQLTAQVTETELDVERGEKAKEVEESWEEIVARAQARTLEVGLLSERGIADAPKVVNRDISPIYFSAQPTTAILTGDAALGWDTTNDPGYDISDTNDRVRSFDKLFYTFQVNLSSTDGRLYKDIKAKISGTIKNGISAKSGNLNAQVPTVYGGKSNLNTKVSDFEFIYDVKGNEGISTGSNRLFTIPLEVFGAANQTELSIDNFKIELIEGTDDKGQRVAINLLQNILGMAPTDVSSKVSLAPYFRPSWSEQYLPFNLVTKGTDDANANIRQLGLAIELVPIAGRTSASPNRFLGVAAPEDALTVTMDQRIQKSVTGTVGWTNLTLGVDTRSMTLFDYGNPGVAYPNNLNQPYPNYRRLVRSLYVPGSYYNGADNTVFDSGKYTATDMANHQSKVTFSNYKVNGQMLPNRGQTENPGVMSLKNRFFFLSLGMYLKEPTEQLADDVNLNYTMSVSKIEIADSEKTTIIPKATDNWKLNWVLYRYPPGGMITYSMYQNKNSQPTLGQTTNTVATDGLGVLSEGAEFIAKSTVYNSAQFWAKDSQVLQKWNPNESTFISVSQNNVGLLDDSGYTTKKTIQYGVSKLGVYDYLTLDKNRMANYNWYPTVAAAQASGKISAILGGSTGERNGSQYEQVMVRRKLNPGIVGAKDKQGNHLVTASWGSLAWELDGSRDYQDPVSQAWRPTEYNAIGVATTQEYNGRYGDTILVVPAKLSVQKKSLSYQSNVEQATFKASEKASFLITPNLTVDAQDPQEDRVVTVVDTLPKGMRYIAGSSTAGGVPLEPIISGPNAAGAAILTWQVSGIANRGVPAIRYDTLFIQSDVTFNSSGVASMVNTAIASSPGLNSAASLRTGSQSISLIQEKKWEIDKQVDTLLMDVNDNAELTYVLRAGNQLKETLTGINILDVLPQDGDGLGSSFSGSYQLTKIQLLGDDNLTPIPGAKAYYTNNVISRNADPNSQAASLAGWTAMGNSPVAAKAILATIPSLPDGQFAHIRVTIVPSGNHPGDVLRNMATGNSTGFEGKVSSQHQETNIAKRSIEGIAWYDANNNGQLDENENRKANVPITLFSVGANNTLTKVTTDLRGKALVDSGGNSLVKTDANGYYLMDALPASEYVVGFGIKAEIDSGDLYLTGYKEIGVPASLSNKVDSSLIKEGSYLTPLSDRYTFPAKLTSLAEGKIQYINLGVLAKPDLIVKKKVLGRLTGNGGRPDLDNQEVKVGDTLHYEIQVSNPNANSITKDIKVSDRLASGLTYKAGTLQFTNAEGVTSKLPDNLFLGQNLTSSDLGSLIGPTETVTVAFDVTINSDASGKIVNVAKATGKQFDTPTAKDSNEVTNNAAPLPSLTKEISENEATLNQLLTYKLIIKNEKGGGKWQNIVLTDHLPTYLSYVTGSLTIDGVSKPDGSYWNGDNLSLPIKSLSSNETSTVTFKVKVMTIPNNRVIQNKANVTGKDGDGKVYAPPEAKVELPIPYVLLNVRQSILADDKTILVAPKKGYVTISQSPTGTNLQQQIQMNLQIDSTLEGEIPIVTQSLFTTRLIRLSANQTVLEASLAIPEYYEFAGHVQTTTATTLAADHISSKRSGNSASQSVVLDYANKSEQWLTLFIEPKLGNGETDPRAYSWDTKHNEFGKFHLGR